MRLRAVPAPASDQRWADRQAVTVRGQRFSVDIRPGTDPTRPPLLLCNGIGAGLKLLDPFVRALDPALEVIRFDAPGAGGSPVPLLPYPLPVLARLVGRLLDALGHHDEVDVLGVSWGGVLAQQLAFQNPRRCRRLVLVATSPGWTMVPAAPSVLMEMATPRRSRATAGDLYGGGLRGRPDLVDALVGDHDEQASTRGYLYQLATGLGWTNLPFLPLIRQPTLLLSGSDDPIVPTTNARIMARLMPNARVHVYPDGHLGLITRATELAPAISAFLTER